MHKQGWLKAPAMYAHAYSGNFQQQQHLSLFFLNSTDNILFH
jgi:hypothetical protein